MVFPPIPSLRDLLRLLNIKACKSLSQNFLLQPWPIKNFVNAIGTVKNSYILEVGPGPGSITREILQRNPAHLAVVELDRRFLIMMEQLREVAQSLGIKMDIYNQDILKFNSTNVFPELLLNSTQIHPDNLWIGPNLEIGKEFSTVVKEEENVEGSRVHLVGNLPFNISTPLLAQWLQDISEKRGLWAIARVPMTLTFQREVAERLIAKIYNPERCRFSVVCNSLCETRIKNIIPGTAFLPKAKVDCAVVHIVPRREPLINVPYPYLAKITKGIFQFKQKKVFNGIESLFPANEPDLVVRMFAASGVSPASFPIQMSDDEFKYLAEEYFRICSERPDVFSYDFRKRHNEFNFRDRKKIQRVFLDGKTLNAQTVQHMVDQAHQEMQMA